ncbi:DoxX family protein [Demequina lutea]|uniref:Putative membrane protein YphA (DoxX/SURF4 family) n=1 Tax=Demequina lutea TaxID=431489 RepID=A0A7Z0CI14_9MICO|nr:DoxX family protein [Demequina lutea]NYI42076.1 putative membrane protein YphA (DoxX/SURF4 family) [Demequina lutea]
MNAVFLIARILFALIFLLSAMGHMTNAAAMAGYAKFKGAPGGKAGVIASGVTMGLGAIMVLLGIYGDLGALLVFATLIPVSFFMHAYWKVSDAQAKQMDRTNFNKNIGLMGGALALFLLFAVTNANLGLTITGPLFHLS